MTRRRQVLLLAALVVILAPTLLAALGYGRQVGPIEGLVVLLVLAVLVVLFFTWGRPVRNGSQG